MNDIDDIDTTMNRLFAREKSLAERNSRLDEWLTIALILTLCLAVAVMLISLL